MRLIVEDINEKVSWESIQWQIETFYFVSFLMINWLVFGITEFNLFVIAFTFPSILQLRSTYMNSNQCLFLQSSSLFAFNPCSLDKINNCACVLIASNRISVFFYFLLSEN